MRPGNDESSAPWPPAKMLPTAVAKPVLALRETGMPKSPHKSPGPPFFIITVVVSCAPEGSEPKLTVAGSHSTRGMMFDVPVG